MLNNWRIFSTARKLLVAGLVAGAAGISILFLTNSVSVPAIPFGPIILLLVAGLVALAPWRWTSIVGTLAALFVLGGAFIAPGLFARLSNPAQLSGFIGTWVQVVGLVVAIVAGYIATMRDSVNASTASSRKSINTESL